jgi:hypothetical protein
MHLTRRWLVILTTSAVVVAVLVAVYPSVAQLARGRLTESSLEPRAVMLLPEGNDPRVVMVGVTWSESGWCVGQFHVTSTETTTDVRVGTVVSRLYENDVCAGVGTVNNMAWADLTLKAPLGSRVVVRTSDDVVLPVVGP